MAKKKPAYVGCTVPELPASKYAAAVATAWEHNPANRPRVEEMAAVMVALQAPDGVLAPGHLAVLTTRYWGAKGVKLGVSFMDNPSAALRDKILDQMNAWGAFCNAQFAWSQSQGQVRISRGQGGYWSYLGTDILQIPRNQPTMNLQGFTVNTPEAEFVRVVRHEVGHTLGFPHEHARRQLVQRLDPQKTVAYFRRTQGWDERTVQQQVLTPLEESAIMGTPDADGTSIMCYGFPGSITRDGQPIPGGNDINATDKAFAARLYPLEVTPPPPPGQADFVLARALPAGSYRVVAA